MRTIHDPLVAAALDNDRAPVRQIAKDAQALGAYDRALLRQLDGLLTELARERGQGRRLYRFEQRRRDGLLEADELDPALAKEAVLVGYVCFGTIRRACQQAQVPRELVEDWKLTDPAFGRLLLVAHDEVGDRVQERIFRRVMDPRAAEDRGSAVLSIFLAKALKPHLFRDDLPPVSAAATATSVRLNNMDNPYLALAQAGRQVPPAALPSPPSPTAVAPEPQPQ